ncbi:hypothetical protein MUU77_09155 [Pseudoxanthomonas sp. F37]|uniref:hypothetical protein n=1 Tax=Pseudoxanthomonas TaxID=83618 RepID=UPI001FD1E7F9|nr:MULTISPECIES: hypothetical protein [Pseudoxanthomonas]UOV05401.1 hypothetical protein MUU75_01310 [Pseudoxanthomonas mexicana]UOV10405.1 hypothetical protein MUU77_09155 [Pseudoxanthomonas sp. F37]
MKAPVTLLVLLGLLAGCDRRDDPEVSRESQEVIHPPGDAVGNASGTLSPQHPPESTLEPTTPAVVPPRCEGLTGGQLARCIQEDAGEAPEPASPEPQDGTR